MYTQEHSEEVSDTSAQRSQQGEELHHKIIRSLPATILLILSIISWIIYFYFKFEWKSGTPIHWLPVSILMTITTFTIIWLQNKWFIPKNTSSFNLWIFGVTIIGGSISFLFPLAIIDNFSKDGEGTALRQMLIYATGGLLGVITLSETRRKNDQEKRKNEQEKEKNENDHIRQVHAERRSRYAKGVEQLANENAAIRLGGVYTLVGLTDEWLADKNLQPKKRQKEGQVIINNLCAYIRSIPNGLTGIDLESGAAPSDEAKLRQTIFSEMSNRINPKNQKDSTWADLKFDFSDSPIFYPLDDKVFMNADFQKSNFYELASFSRSKFYGETKFTGSNFYIRSKFDKSEFYGTADFASTRLGMPLTTNANWKNMKNQLRETIRYASIPRNIISANHSADFSEVFFEQKVNFNEVYFYIKASFESSNFSIEPDFDSSYFTCKEESNFSTHSNNIQLEVAELTDKSGNIYTQEIPVGSRLFDPKSWSSREEKYTCVSEPARLLDKSSDSKEDKST
ncbi:pentapeptide repeat-containing protein [Rothia sp. RSM407]|uniref:pentapeptide repeat-containing protein n=1 Tax=Rothia sp. RSM407 TaxID=3398581 RepID=UPI002447C60F|nr:pentapeptide repeat-containing protein [Rothia mucilaginosa]